MKWLRKSAAVFKLSLQLFLLTCVHFVGFIVAAHFSSYAPPAILTTTADQTVGISAEEAIEDPARTDGPALAADAVALRMLSMIVLVCAANSLVLVTWIKNSSAYGWRLMLIVFFVFLMCLTVMPQMETVFFLGNARGIVRHAAVMGLVVCALVSLSMVPILGRWKKPHSPAPCQTVLRGVRDGSWRFAVCAVVYVMLYLVFGYFVAWRNPSVRSLYGGTELLGFWNHVTSSAVLKRLIPFQLLRGVIWTGLCLAVMRVTYPGWCRRAIVVGLVFAVLMNAQLLIPNPMMTHNVRMTHLIETATSNFLFGIFCVWFWFNDGETTTVRQG